MLQHAGNMEHALNCTPGLMPNALNSEASDLKIVLVQGNQSYAGGSVNLVNATSDKAISIQLNTIPAKPVAVQQHCII